MSVTIEEVREGNLREVNDYLQAHEDSAQFLINNLHEHGFRLTEHSNSGNFKLLREQGRIVAVFVLARRGNLLIQAESDFSAPILEACRAETLAPRGFIGDFASVEPVWRLFRELNPDFQATYESKEILYSYSLAPEDRRLQSDPRVRLLTLADFAAWLKQAHDSRSELSLPDDLSDAQKQQHFAKQTARHAWWGLFENGELRARVGLNSKGPSVGQVGGVLTPPEFRRRGYAQATMFHMLKDCRDLHGHRRSILFTGASNIPAQKLYEAMGYCRIGFFSLILS